MERYAIVSEIVIVHLQVLSECVEQLWGENVISAKIQTDDVQQNDKKIIIKTLEIAIFMSYYTDRKLFTRWFCCSNV
jgi:hypothetical protein